MSIVGKIFAFRVDASINIGTGHVMRCLTLAGALASEGGHCHFICRNQVGNLAGLITHLGHQVHLLENEPNHRFLASSTNNNSPPAHAAWLTVNPAIDALQTAELLSTIKPDWLICDHYALDAFWEHTQRPYVTSILAIDDLADRRHDCDLLLDQSLGRKEEDYEGLVAKYCRKLLGPQFALLRPEFAKWRERSLQRRKLPRLQSLLLNMGGVDKDNMTGLVLQKLQACQLPPDFRITVVMGATAPWLDDVQRLAKRMNCSVEVMVDVREMAKLMANSDLAIGAAGATSWERCVLGLPTIMAVLAQNQRHVADQLSMAGAVCIMPEVEHIPDLILSLYRNRDQLREMTTVGANIADGLGISRVIDILGGEHD